MAKTRNPYMQPVPLTCEPEKVENGVKLDMVKEYIHKHENNLRRYQYLGSLYRGFHDIYKEPEKDQWKPDNRLAVGFPRYMTETFVGYAYGIPIRVKHPDENIDQKIQEFGRDNEVADHNLEMAKLCCQYGHAWEYIYQTEESKTKLTACSPEYLFTVYDDTLKERALFAVRYGRHKTDERPNGELYGEIMTRETLRQFDGESLKEERANPYGMIPVVEWRLNDERIGLYEEQAGLIESYNRAISEKANDVDAFAEAYLAALGVELDEEGYRKIRDNRLINLYGTDSAKDVLVHFLQKPTADATQENLLNRLEQQIYQTSMVANISDENFGSANSGKALAYKLQAMSNLAGFFDKKIDKSLRKRYKIFCSLSTNVERPDAWGDIEIKFSRNVPQNIAEEAEIAATLEGQVSKETQLSVLSIVDDPKEEINRMEEEHMEEQARFLDMSMGEEPQRDGD